MANFQYTSADLASSIIALLFLTVFLACYLRKTKVIVAYSNIKFSKFIDSARSLKSKRFCPFPLLSFALGQCYLSFQRCEDDAHLIQMRESFNYPRGGQGHVEWITDSLNPSKNFATNLIAFVLPGLRSKPDAPYLRDLFSKLLKRGIRPVLFVPRFNDSELVLPKEGYLDLIDDMHHAVQFVKSKYPEAKLIAIGHSFGANTLVNYLARYNEETNMLAGVSIANPFNLVLSSKFVRGTIIERHLVKGMKEIINGGLDNIMNSCSRYNLSISDLLKANTIEEIDSEFSCKVFGCKDDEEYYELISSGKRLKDVRVPLLLINAEDDPFISPKGLPRDAHVKNENLLFVRTQKGGHLGWVEGIFKLKRWYIPVVTDFVKWIAEERNIIIM